jgi:hypothetical protein
MDANIGLLLQQADIQLILDLQMGSFTEQVIVLLRDSEKYFILVSSWFLFSPSLWLESFVDYYLLRFGLGSLLDELNHLGVKQKR